MSHHQQRALIFAAGVSFGVASLVLFPQVALKILLVLGIFIAAFGFLIDESDE